MTREKETQKAAIEARCAVATLLSGDRYSSVDLLPDWIREDLSYDELIEKSFAKGAEWADTHHAKKQAVTIEAWVAKDTHSFEPWLYTKRPYSEKGIWYTEQNSEDILDFDHDCIPLQEDHFKQLTFENSPKKVKVIIEMED